ncbi:MAG: TRAP transporter small permease [Hyphomicrobiaceae bacterium]|nr:TRAP transporter small permease [Hyphomicrobiaceae bacterium]
MLRKLLDGLYLGAGYLAGVFLIAILCLMMALSIGREIGLNVKSGDDITAWCMAAMAFLGLAHTFKSGEMIRVGLLTDRLTGRAKWLSELFSLVMAGIFIGYFAWQVVVMTYTSWLINDMSTGVLVVPLWFPQLGFTIGLVILFIAIVDELVHVLAGNNPRYLKEAPKTAEELVERAAQSGV